MYRYNVNQNFDKVCIYVLDGPELVGPEPDIRIPDTGPEPELSSKPDTFCKTMLLCVQEVVTQFM